jgi:hypothetical protein
VACTKPRDPVPALDGVPPRDHVPALDGLDGVPLSKKTLSIFVNHGGPFPAGEAIGRPYSAALFPGGSAGK